MRAVGSPVRDTWGGPSVGQVVHLPYVGDRQVSHLPYVRGGSAWGGMGWSVWRWMDSLV